MTTRTSLATLTLLVLLVAQTTPADQSNPKAQSPSDALRSVQQNSDDIEQLRADLRSPNPSVRVASFTVMIGSGNPALMATAINEGHASSDATLRDLSARAAFRELKGLVLEPIGVLSGEQQDAFLNFSNPAGLVSKIEKYDWATGVIEIWNGAGQVSGTRLSLRTNFCQTSLTAVEGSWTYEGLVVCINGPLKLATKMHASIR